MTKEIPGEPPEDLEAQFLTILRDWSRQVDAMARAAATAEAEFISEVANKIGKKDVAVFDADPILKANGKLAFLRAFDRIADVVGLGDRKDDLFDRHCDALWPSRSDAAPGRAGGGGKEADLLKRALEAIRGGEGGRRKQRRPSADSNQGGDRGGAPPGDHRRTR